MKLIAMVPRNVLVIWMLVGGLWACGGAKIAPCGPVEEGAGAAQSSVDQVTIESLPGWTDKYAEQNEGDMRFFAISELMARYALDRTQAAEVQNHYRDATRTQADLSSEAALQLALARVRAGELERFDREAVDKAAFVVVFDLDATLYDQYPKAGKACADVTFRAADGKEKAIVLAPGWDEAFARVRAAGGAVVIFSANTDPVVEDNLRHWQWEGVSLWEHSGIAAILTNSHLVLQSKHEGPGREKPRKGRPVVVPSKDLRIIDATLERVVLIDDNPKRVVQHDRQRLIKKFDGDALCAAERDEVKELYRRTLLHTIDEVEESAAFAVQHGVSFATAYLPYTMLGRVAVDALMETRGWELDQAVAFVRAQPDLVDRRF